MPIKVAHLKETIENLLKYLEPFLPLANVHMVDYFTKNVFELYTPTKIRNEINEIGHKNAMERIFDNKTDDLPNLNKYIEKSRYFTLKNLDICLNIDKLIDNLSQMGSSNPQRLKLDVFMTSKKSHEVDILSYIVAYIKNISGISHLIDIGDGKGYLSSMLALHHKIPVLGVDAVETNTDGAVRRVNKLAKVWNSEVSKKINKDLVLPNEMCNFDLNKNNKSEIMYKQVTKYVDEKVDFVELISNTFLETPNGLGLVGLHTCGNLAPICLKIFSANDGIKTICNVGCCYHLIKESFENDDNEEYNIVDGFPMSHFLKEKKVQIGRAARMIAAQSMERILDKRETPNETLFYRALLEVILEKEFKHLPSDKRQVGRFRKSAVDFLDYTKKALKRLNLSTRMSDLEIENLLEEYKDRKYELFVFFLLRNMLGPIIECLILLDRLLYLYESGFQNSYLVQFFDPVISPRCYGIVAIK